MNNKTTENKNNWLSSKEAMKAAKIKSCDLMHYRIQGKMKFKKAGNAFFYAKESVHRLKK